MAAPKILTFDDRPTRPKPERALRGPVFGWTLLGYVGLVFAIIGMLDVGLTWWPGMFGNAEWEFGSVSASLNGLPLPSLGLTLVLASGVARGDRVTIVAATSGFVVLTILLAAAGFLYVTVVPLALRDVTNEAVRTGLMKSIVKALALLLLYPTLYVCVAVSGWRAARAR